MDRTDAAIDRLGLDLLRNLHAIAWFCDSTPDGKHALIPSDRRHDYESGGDMAELVAMGCVRLLKSSKCAVIGASRPAVRMEQFGRTVLVRAKALRLDLDPPPSDEVEGD